MDACFSTPPASSVLEISLRARLGSHLETAFGKKISQFGTPPLYCLTQIEIKGYFPNIFSYL